jgi:hypothetical protein
MAIMSIPVKYVCDGPECTVTVIGESITQTPTGWLNISGPGHFLGNFVFHTAECHDAWWKIVGRDGPNSG